MTTHSWYVTDLKVITAFQMECTMHTREQADFKEICSFCVKIVCHYKAQWWTACTELYHLRYVTLCDMLLFAIDLTASTFEPSLEHRRHVSALTSSNFCSAASRIILHCRSNSLMVPCSWSTVPRIQTTNPLHSIQSVPQSSVVFQN